MTSRRLADRERLISRFLQGRRLRATSERKAIAREIAARGARHFSAEELVARFRRRGTQVSRATVYRTLEHLVSGGLVRRLSFGRKHALYEGNEGGARHGHLICLDCGRIAVFTSEPWQRPLDSVARRRQFQARAISIQVFGSCRRCATRDLS
ncbi:MAG TPA: transcriptional repressor [Thermoanaerobaculia bacterium]|nr:transcriptional repressor [Thermoanaerobaculia bacterium]